MKKILIVLVVIVTMAIFLVAETRIGIINAQRLLQETARGKAVSAKIENVGKDKRIQAQALQAEIVKLEKDIASPALNISTKEKKALDLQNKKTELKRFIEDSDAEIQRLSQIELGTLQEEIKPIIQKVGQQKGLTVIMEITVVAYFDETADITNDVIKMMDSQLKPK